MTITGRDVKWALIELFGLRSCIIKNGQVKNPSVVGTQCILHCMTLGSRSLPLKMNRALNLAIEVVN